MRKRPSHHKREILNARGMQIPVVEGEQGNQIPTVEQLVGKHWGPLATLGSRKGPRSITREQLAEAMAAGEQPLLNDVTRFLLQPGLTVGHQSLEFDLKVAVAASMSDGLQCGVTRADGEGGEWVFPFSELFPVGIMHGVTRMVIEKLLGAQFDNMIGELQASGKLLTPDMTDSAMLARSRRPDDTVDCPACNTNGICPCCSGLGWVERPPEPATGGEVHHLQVHPEYLIDDDGVSTAPVRHDEPPLCGV